MKLLLVSCGVIGSVYINVGKIKEIDTLEEVISKIRGSHKRLIVCLDSHSRSLQWDPSCIHKKSSSPVREMGDRFEELCLSHSLNVLNNGQLTYYNWEFSSAVDITITHGIEHIGPVKWQVIDDFLQTPHKGIIIEAGKKEKFQKTKIIDWHAFDWTRYSIESKSVLKKLYSKWKDPKIKVLVNEMAKDMQDSLQKLVTDIGKTKFITKHSKPWITPEVKKLIEDMKEIKIRTRKHRSARNKLILQEKLNNISVKLEEAHIQYVNQECEKLNTLTDSKKWKAISKLLKHDNFSTVQPIKVGNKHVFEDKEILAEMEKYHVDKPGAQKITLSPNLKQWIEEARLSNSNDIMDHPISMFEIESIYNTCSETPGADGFMAKLIDNADRETMNNCLLTIWQKAWSEGTFIKEWKQEHRAVLPKPNKDSYNECNSYRTVSLTPILGKRFEKISSNRLKAHLENINFDRENNTHT